MMMGTGAAGNFLLALTALLPAYLGVRGELPDFPVSTKDVKIRMGYYTEGGKYLGGVPRFSNEDGLYQCTDLNYEQGTYYVASGGNASVCMSWRAVNQENQNITTNLQRCLCEDAATSNAEYCASWSCGLQDEGNTLNCPGGVSPCTLDYEPTVDTSRCTCQTANEGEVEGGEGSSSQQQQTSSGGGKFCAAWTCLGWDADGVEESTEFQCVRDSPSGEYCDGWTGMIERSKELQASTCDCIGQWNGDGVCTYWECEQRTMPLCSNANDPNMSWCNVGIAVGLWGLLGSIGAFFVAAGLMRLVQDTCVNVFFLGFFLMAVFSVPVVIWGGQDAAVYVGIWWGAIVLVGMAYGYWTKPV